MKKRILQALLVLGGVSISLIASSQVSEAFNTRPSAFSINDIKPYLQDRCWSFPDMDVNKNGWNPGIDGDGAMVSGLGANQFQNTGIYTPFLNIPGNMTVSFNYKFNAIVASRRWVKLYLTDANDNIHMMLDSVELTGKSSGSAYNYSHAFSGLPSGPYRLYINYQGNGGAVRIGIDQLSINVPFLYNGGCNQAPVAVDDNVRGLSNHTATGSVNSNDYDANGDYFSSYLITNSPDGTVEMGADGQFTFIPKPSFAGSTTSFTYQVCDVGFGPLCSNPATVKITFPTAGMLPVRLSDFFASINDDQEVNIRWKTNFEQGSDRFEIERSFDGSNFEKIGQVKGAGTSSIKLSYSYDDTKLRSSIANKKDVYYRLRMVDVNNRAEVSKVLVVRVFKTKTTQMISVSPNPVMNDITVQVQLKENSYVVMKIANSNGTEVARKSVRGNKGLNILPLDGTSKLTPGIYMLEVIINSNERMTTKLIKN